jgi:hypothetical protein
LYLADLPLDNPDDFAPATLNIGGGTLNVEFAARPGLPRDALLRWIETAATAVTRYYGEFPVERVTIRVRGATGNRIRNGWTFGGRLIRVDVGRAARQGDLDDDWLMTHEMFHLGFPDVDRQHHWMEEGLSTYLEPVARARIGVMPEGQYWKELVEGLPRGLPRDGDRGLDRTPTWGRTYWGGCLFWFTADLEIRKQTGNRKTLDDAIRAIHEAGGNGTTHWTLDRILIVGDRATGTTVLRDLHERMGTRPEQTDLAAVWRELGVVYRDGRVTFDDGAPQASIRRSMIARLPN